MMQSLPIILMLAACLTLPGQAAREGNNRAPQTGPIGVEATNGHPLAYVNHAASVRMWSAPATPMSVVEKQLQAERTLQVLPGQTIDSRRNYPGEILVLHNGARRISHSDANPIPIDESGWPKADVQGVIFDERPAFAWAPPEDDPQKKQPKESGVFKLSLQGYADMKSASPPLTVANAKYDESSNTMSADVTLPEGAPDLMVIEFTNTRRTSKSENGTGFTNLRITYPGYEHNTEQLFLDPYLEALKPFDHMRFMGFTGTNYQPWMCGGDEAVYCSVIEWKDRPLPTDAMFGDTTVRAGAHGQPWEYIILLANQVKKDIWINIPVSASGAGFKGTHTPADEKQSYIYQLALLLRNGNEFTGNKGLDKSLNIYFEHSNEVWNFGFHQYGYNQAAAKLEVQKGGSQLNNNKVPWVNGSNEQVWGHRRHLERIHQIVQVFQEVFGASSVPERIRPIYAWWSIFPKQYNNTLSWAEATYGDVNKYLWGIAGTHYYSDTEAAREGASVSDVIQALKDDSDKNVNRTKALAAIKEHFKLKLCSYEAGTGTHVGNRTNIGNRILAQRDPRITQVIIHDVRDNYWPLGGDSYNYFTLNGEASRYGCFFLLEDLFEPLDTYKMKAIWELTGYKP
ncbi:uncharacterized protein LOC135805558 [Sycon ciliatum]|uniref:uncharacterized protein LOC135805558 n=1 Tax=Sycon ciliatum TaxID=27933 RepID=UPI0031F6EA75